MNPAPELMPTLLAASLHEVKNLLGELTLSLDDLRASCPDKTDEIGQIRFVARRVTDRLLQVLTLYKSEGSRLSLNLQAAAPGDLLEELAAELATLAGGRVRVQVRREQVPEYAFFDWHLCQMALTNAIHNALSFARERIDLSVSGQGRGIVFMVEDDGPGFPAQILQQPFAPVFHSRDGGTGLGLYFASVVAELHCNNAGHCGRIVLDNGSSLGGARFQMELP